MLLLVNVWLIQIFSRQFVDEGFVLLCALLETCIGSSVISDADLYLVNFEEKKIIEESFFIVLKVLDLCNIFHSQLLLISAGDADVFLAGGGDVFNLT
jgi:hypothetical protein